MWCYMDWFSHVIQPCIPRTNPTWLWCMLILYICLFWVFRFVCNASDSILDLGSNLQLQPFFESLVNLLSCSSGALLCSPPTSLPECWDCSHAPTCSVCWGLLHLYSLGRMVCSFLFLSLPNVLGTSPRPEPKSWWFQQIRSGYLAQRNQTKSNGEGQD